MQLNLRQHVCGLMRGVDCRRGFALLAILGVAFVAGPAGGHWVAAETALAVGDPVIAVAGDIACDPTNSNFNGGNGKNDACQQKWTYDLFANAGVAQVLPLGDTQYYCGGYTAFLQSYDLSWGQAKAITRPVVGNHEYLTSGGTDCTSANAGADGYFKYFASAAGEKGKGYYSYDIGTWHLIALNSNCGDAGGCSATSPQGIWLKNDLAAHANVCTAAYWHIPLFSSGGRASTNAKSLWQILYDNNADVVLSGHDHDYERFAPQKADGTVDTVRGIREFIVGTGGANHTSFTALAANSEVRNDTTYGVLELTLHPTSYDWQFVPQAGQSFTDTGTTSCHGSTSDVTPPTAPTNLAATAVGPGHVDLSWTASTDNVGVAGYRIYRDGVQLATTTATAFSDLTAAPSTTYGYSVVAFDVGLNVSPASNIASVTTPADTTPPTGPTNLTATAAGPTEVDLSWSASSDDVAVAGYQVFRDGVQIATSVTASYADTATQATTTYTYSVFANDTGGNVSAASNSALITTPAQPTTLMFGPSADTYVEADTPTVNYGSATTIIADNSPIKRILLKFLVAGVNGRAVLSAKLRLYCVDPSPFGGSFHRVGDAAWSEAAANWNNAPAGDVSSLAGLGAVAASTWYEIDVTPLVSGDGTVSLDATSTSSDGAHYSSKEGAAGFAPQLVVTTASAPADTTPPAAPLNLLASAVGPARVDLSWMASTDDTGVAGYQILRDGVQIGTATGTSFSDMTAQPDTLYTYTARAFDAAGNSSGDSDPASVTTPADTSPPTAPANLAAATAQGGVSLTWSSSSDDVGVVEYDVKRNGVQVGATTTTSFSDVTVQPATTYTYTVVAVDGAANASPDSNAATVTTPAPNATLTFTPIDDSYVESDLPASNFGRATAMGVDNKPVKNILLKFSVAGIGSGTVRSAKLRLFCVDASPKGGEFHRLADSTWSETTLNWNNVPTADVATIASLGSVGAGTWYEVDLTPLIVGDGTYSVRATSTSSNGADYSTKEGTGAPQLVVTVS